MTRSAKQKTTGAKRTSSAAVAPSLMPEGTRARFVVCLGNAGYATSLDVRKIYRVVPDPRADQMEMVRVIDDSGEAYLYPKRLFAVIDVSPAVRRRLEL